MLWYNNSVDEFENKFPAKLHAIEQLKNAVNPDNEYVELQRF